MSLGTILQAGIALAQAALAVAAEFDRARDNAELARGLLNAVSDLIQQSTAQVINVVRQQRQDELAGRVDGLFATFVRYSANPEEEGNRERLVRLIDELSIVIGEMNRIVARIDDDESVALTIYPVYANAASLNVVAITERRRRFNPNEPFAGILEQAKDNSERVRDVLRRNNDRRFRFATEREEPGFVTIGYRFEGTFHPIALIPESGNPTEAIARAEAALESRRQLELQRFPGYNETLSFLNEIDAAIMRETVRIARDVSPQRPLDSVVFDDMRQGVIRFRLTQ